MQRLHLGPLLVKANPTRLLQSPLRLRVPKQQDREQQALIVSVESPLGVQGEIGETGTGQIEGKLPVAGDHFGGDLLEGARSDLQRCSVDRRLGLQRLLGIQKGGR